VEYTKGKATTQEMDASQLATLSVIQKPGVYREECEYRFYTILNEDPRHRIAEFLNIELEKPINSAEILRVVEPTVQA